MNQPPNSGMNTPPGYGAPQQPPGYGPQGHPQSGPIPNSGSYQPPPGRSGFTRQMFNPASYRQAGSGSWAAASLILSLISMVLCLGLIAPLPLILGLVGMVGNKRGKGLAFVGFILSALQVVGWVAIFTLGLHLQFQSATMAENAGKPVVAAIADFKNDNQRVPHSLQELVDNGYLPPTWDKGFEGIDSNVEEFVKGKKWQDFLAYEPGEDADWKGRPNESSGSDVSIKGDFDDWSINFPTGDDKPTEYQTYGLSFIGLDGDWSYSSSDNEAVNQSPEEPYDLSQLWDGDATTRDAMKKKRELQVMLNKVDTKLGTIDKLIESAEASLKKHENRLFEIAEQKGLTRAQIKTDSDTKEWLKLIGETTKRLRITEKKKTELQSTRNKLEVQMERLANQVELAKLADNKEQLIELQKLLDESKEALDGEEDSYFTNKSDDDFADEWLNSSFK
ncbi:MAG: hypothetical protein KDB68_13570 [Planctomycetes bacterium]|nr:hypothetical protein [Planctomycetota bacterium]